MKVGVKHFDLNLRSCFLFSVKIYHVEDILYLSEDLDFTLTHVFYSFIENVSLLLRIFTRLIFFLILYVSVHTKKKMYIDLDIFFSAIVF